MVLGCAGKVPKVTAKVCAVPDPHVVLGVTVQVPDVPAVYDTVMALVLLPDVIVALVPL